MVFFIAQFGLLLDLVHCEVDVVKEGADQGLITYAVSVVLVVTLLDLYLETASFRVIAVSIQKQLIMGKILRSWAKSCTDCSFLPLIKLNSS